MSMVWRSWLQPGQGETRERSAEADVPSEPTSGLRAVVESRLFENFIMAVIVINAIAIGVETADGLSNNARAALAVIDSIALTIFTVEIAMKLIVYRLRFFANGWNLFDFAIVAAALIPATAGYSILRALRILRAFRLISVMPRMRQVVQGLFSSIPSMGTVVLLLALIFYIAAVIATKLFGQSFPQWFGSVGDSLFSLFQIMTLESWSMGIVRPVMEQYPHAWAFFVPFILITSFIVLNLFIAIIVNAMHEASDEEAGDERDLILEEVRALRKEVAALRGDERST